MLSRATGSGAASVIDLMGAREAITTRRAVLTCSSHLAPPLEGRLNGQVGGRGLRMHTGGKRDDAKQGEKWAEGRKNRDVLGVDGDPGTLEGSGSGEQAQCATRRHSMQEERQRESLIRVGDVRRWIHAPNSLGMTMQGQSPTGMDCSAKANENRELCWSRFTRQGGWAWLPRSVQCCTELQPTLTMCSPCLRSCLREGQHLP